MKVKTQVRAGHNNTVNLTINIAQNNSGACGGTNTVILTVNIAQNSGEGGTATAG